MNASALTRQLQQLHELILEEREHAKALRVTEMLAVAEVKEQLLQRIELAETDELDGAVRQLAVTVREENRRNAYLFWAALNWLRDLMGFFRQQAAPPAYGCGAVPVRSDNPGLLLSGRI